MQNNLADIALADVMELLDNDSNPWPRGYTRVKKIQFLADIKQYYTEKENYLILKKIDEHINRIKSEPFTIKRTK